MIACPSAAQWQDLLTQDVPDPDEAAFLAHALACASCQAVLDRLTRPEGLPQAWLAQAEKDTPVPLAQSTDTPPHHQPQDPFRTVDFPARTVPADRGQLVPGYEILEELGRGGMGVVFKARHLELNRLVALKMLRDAALADAGMLARFRDEARAVARLQHPGIVQIHEIGTLEGQPYLALEYIPGRSLERHLQGTPQPPRDAAALMIPLAQAIHAAHLQGILHRDLKPANVLLTFSRAPEARATDHLARVGEDQACATDSTARASGARLNESVPKITDFGLAKPLDDDTRRTETGVVAGTPCYMAPEQAAGQKRLGPAVDIYALGAILYELITGRPPFKGVTAFDTIHLVLTEEPVPPRRLQPQVPRDLETICLKCLQKEPAKRYLTAADLAADLERFLDGRPILARPATRLERAVKWCRRYPTVAALLVVATLVAVVATALAVWAKTATEGERLAKLDAQQKEKRAVAAADKERTARLEEERQRQRAEANETKAVNAVAAEKTAKERAQKRLAQIAKGNEIITAIFTDLDVRAVKQGTEPLEAVLAKRLVRAAEQLEGEAVGDPLVVAGLQDRLGVSLLSLGHPKSAIPLFVKARATRTSGLGADHPDTLSVMHNLASAYQMDGKQDLALPLMEETLKLRKAKLGTDHPDTLASMNNLAEGYRAAGKPDLALPLWEETLKLRKAKLGTDHPDTLASMNNLAEGYQAAGKLDLALPLWEETLKLTMANLGADHPITLISMGNLAEGYRAAGKLNLALPLLEETFTLMKAKLGAEHPDTLRNMNNLAGGYLADGKLALALPLLEETFKLKKAKLGADHPETLTSMNNLAGGYQTAGKLDLALSLWEETLKLRKAKLGADHSDTRLTESNLNFCSRLLESTERYRKALATRGPAHIDTLLARRDMAQMYMSTNQLNEAESALVDVLQGMKGRAPDDSIVVFTTRLMRQCLALRNKKQPDVWMTFNTMSTLGGAILGQKKYVEAEPLLLQGYAGMKRQEAQIPPEEKPRLVEAVERLIELYTAANKPDKVKQWQAERAKYPTVVPPQETK